MLVVMLVGVSAILLSKFNKSQFTLEDQRRTIQALNQAKEALLGYAARYYDDYPGRYGFLPCPDVDNNVTYAEGVEHGNCAGKNVSSLGRLPWRTLGLPPLYDGARECLWYAVSGPYKNATTDTARTDMLNEDTNGLFEVFRFDGTSLAPLTGNLPENRAVAVIIAPGRALSNQNRAPLDQGVELCGGNYRAYNYLEFTPPNDGSHWCTNPLTQACVNNAFLTKVTPDPDDQIKPSLIATVADRKEWFMTTQDDFSNINDRIVYITRQEIADLIHKRTDFDNNMECLTQVVTHCLVNYAKSNPNFASGDKRLAWPAPTLLPDYRDSGYYDDQAAMVTGRFPNTVNDSNTSIGKGVPVYLITDANFSATQVCNFSAIAATDIGACNSTKVMKPQYLIKCNPNSTDIMILAHCNQKDTQTEAYTREKCKKCEIEDPSPSDEADCAICTSIRRSSNAVEVLRTLWKHWKDHFFYDVATAYRPTATLPIACNNTDTNTNNDCVKFVSKTGVTHYYAAIIKFAGKRVDNQTRNTTPDADTKYDKDNYLEPNSSSTFNDTLYCIEENLTVVPCPFN